MLSARTVVILVVLLVAVSVVGTVVSMLATPDSAGLAADSYGTRAHGYRAIFEILSTLNVTDERALKPPGAALDRSATLVLWAPQEALVADEPLYLQHVAQWVRDGGRVVLGVGKPGDPGKDANLASREVAAKKRRRPRSWGSQASRPIW